MNKQSQLIAAALAAMLGLGGCSTAPPDSTAPPASTGPAAVAPASNSPMPAMTGSGDAMAGMVHIESGAYRNAAPVAAGSMVTVMNMDSTPYTVTSDDGYSFHVTVPAGAMATFKAPGKPGSYPFHSGGKTGMHGVLSVD